MMRSLTLAVMAVAAQIGPSYAHEWYDAFCCNDKDCIELPEDAVIRTTIDGYEVEYDSPISGRRIHGKFKHNQVKPSMDGQEHGCETSFGTMRCLYLPMSM